MGALVLTTAPATLAEIDAWRGDWLAALVGSDHFVCGSVLHGTPLVSADAPLMALEGLEPSMAASLRSYVREGSCDFLVVADGLSIAWRIQGRWVTTLAPAQTTREEAVLRAMVRVLVGIEEGL